MATTKLKGETIELLGNIPSVGSNAPDFTLVNSSLQDVSLEELIGHNIILNIFPSIDTAVCAMSVRKFNEKADKIPDTKVLAVSHDLPFALQRYCAAEGLNNIIPLSAFRDPDFGKNYGLTIMTGPLMGLLARAVIIIDKNGKIGYTQLVPEIAQEPDYDDALNNLPE